MALAVQVNSLVGNESTAHQPEGLGCSRKLAWHRAWHMQAQKVQVLLAWGKDPNKHQSEKKVRKNAVLSREQRLRAALRTGWEK